MIPKECKRLAEVDFPIAVVGKHSLAEKARRFGTPHQLHLWWAWRPLAACRAMLLALLLPDPCDPHCPAEFKKKARTLLSRTQGEIDPDDMGLRKSLLGFIGDFANWDNSSHPVYMEVGRGLVQAAHKGQPPLVVDSFAGGGSIPLEAIRLGCDAFASDLNPVASLIQEVKLDDLQRYGPALAERLLQDASRLGEAVEARLRHIYPLDPDGARPIAYLWARTVRCEAPNCGAEIPLVRSFWLSKKASRKRALRHKVVRPRGDVPRVEFEIFEPKKDGDVPPSTVSRAKATCPCCSTSTQQTVLLADRVRAQLAAQHGGADVVFDAKGNRVGGARLLAVVTVKLGETGRKYRIASPRDYAAIHAAMKVLQKAAARKLPGGLSPVPDEPLPPIGTLGFRVQRYGMLQWGDLFTARQKVALIGIIETLGPMVSSEARELLALCVSKLAERNNSICDWMVGVECPGHLYTQQVIPPAWDFAESVPLGDSSGSLSLVLENTVTNAISCFAGTGRSADVHLADATALGLPDMAGDVFFTDPPYYDAVPYSDLSDFFFVWLKRMLPGHPLLKDPFDPANPLTPKTREAVQDETKQFDGHPKDRAFFEETMGRAFAEGRRLLKEDGIGCVVFAHKTTEGWEALLTGMISGGWVVTGSWPITTERSARMRARDSAALATSVHLVCRPRPEDAPVGDWNDVFRELPRRVGNWMERLQEEGVRGADLVFACIGPALEIYSRYSKVEDPQGREIPLGADPEASEPHKRGFLAYVWETVGRVALQTILGTAEAKARNGAAGALEEDARLTALFLWALQSTNGQKPIADAAENSESEKDTEDGDEEDTGEVGRATKKAKGFTLIFDVVRRFALPLGIHLDVWEDRIIETDKGIVRLLPVAERAEQLFGQAGAGLAGDRMEEQAKRDPQGKFDFMIQAEAAAVPEVRGRARRGRPAMADLPAEASAKAGVPEESLRARREATTLDRVHAAMLLQAAGKSNALRALLKAEVDRSPDFLRLANALSALYPTGSDEKRLIDAMLLAVPR
ncbi:MAG: DUF1156 domain-containing protein [Planctomycetota bacterium]|nr:DUF1156 domain-containing protein [Planctomycetota bacterium]